MGDSDFLAEVYFERGVSREDLGRSDDAISDYDKALKIKPNYSEALNKRGGC